jgi:hypothetical protein
LKQAAAAESSRQLSSSLDDDDLKNVLRNISVRLLTIEEKLEADSRGAATAAAAVHILEVRRSASLTPSLQELRADKTLTVQAEKLVDDLLPARSQHNGQGPGRTELMVG